MIDLVGKRRFYYLLSLLLMVPGIISLAIPPALRAGIEFTSGSTVTIRFADPSRVSQDQLSAELATMGYGDSRVQSVTGEAGTYIVRTRELQGPQQGAESELDKLERTLFIGLGQVERKDFRSGSALTVKFKDEAITAEPVTAELEKLGYTGSSVVPVANQKGGFVLLTRALEAPGATATPGVGPQPPTEADSLVVALGAALGEVTREGLTAGSATTLAFADPARATAQAVTKTLTDLGYENAQAVPVEGAAGTFLLLTREITGASEAVPSELGAIEAGLREKFGELTREDFSTVSAIVSTKIVRNATFAVIASAVAILLYISWAFRSVHRPFRYGLAAIIAMLHDVVMVVGTYSILGKLFGFEVNTMFITGLLTVIGFSVHDTIVVFDRIRENARRTFELPFAEIVNNSLNETIGRSLNTSMTVVFTLWALLMIGGVTIRSFLVVLLIGIVSGTYSSIAIASQILVSWEEGEFGRLFRRLTFRGGRKERAVEA